MLYKYPRIRAHWGKCSGINKLIRHVLPRLGPVPAGESVQQGTVICLQFGMWPKIRPRDSIAWGHGILEMCRVPSTPSGRQDLWSHGQEIQSWYSIILSSVPLVKGSVDIFSEYSIAKPIDNSHWKFCIPTKPFYIFGLGHGIMPAEPVLIICLQGDLVPHFRIWLYWALNVLSFGVCAISLTIKDTLLSISCSIQTFRDMSVSQLLHLLPH